MLPTIVAILATLLSILAASVLRKLAGNRPIPGLPTAPGAHWLLGHLNLFVDYYNVAHDWVQRLGPAVTMYHPMTGAGLLSASADVGQLFKDRNLVRQNVALIKIFGSYFKYGLIALDGDLWRKHVRVLGPVLSVSRLKASVPIMLNAVASVKTKWRAQLLLEPDRGLGIRADLETLGLAVMAEFLLGDAKVGDSREIIRHCGAILDSINVFAGVTQRLQRMVLGEPLAVKRARAFLKCLVSEAMQNCKKHPEEMEGCAIGQIMKAAKEDRVRFSEREVLEEVTMLLFAGQETTAVTLMWFLKLLAANPKIQDTLRDELDRVLGTSDPTYDDFTNGRLPYLDLCIKEMLRLAPTAGGVARTLNHDITLPGRPDVRLKKGMSVSLAVSVMHRLPEYWVDPERLWPERWEEGEGKGQAAKGLPINPNAYAPFGIGQRMCLGNKMALLELKLVLCQLLRNFCFSPTGNPEFDSMDSVSRLTTHPKTAVVKVTDISQTVKF